MSFFKLKAVNADRILKGDFMKRIVIISIVQFFVLSISSLSQAAILSGNHLCIDLTDTADANAKALWWPSERLSVNADGLGREGPANASCDGWIKTRPLGIGLSWRPTFVARISVEVEPPGHIITLENGQKIYPDFGEVYVRYSPDLKHWSSWQVLQHNFQQSDDEQKQNVLRYDGTIRVPYSERSEYSDRVAAYSRLDVPWASDEEASVRWILESDPEFFSRNLPFIGYVEFLYERSFRAGQRINRFEADVQWSVGGLHLPPKNKSDYKERNDLPWRFKADDKSETTEDSKIECTK
jgi:hypothetical protein